MYLNHKWYLFTITPQRAETICLRLPREVTLPLSRVNVPDRSLVAVRHRSQGVNRCDRQSHEWETMYWG